MTVETSIRGKYFLKILVSGEYYAIDIFNIEEIINRIEITPVPRSPGYIVGIIKVRSEIIPIISMRERLDLQRSKEDQKKIIIFRIHVVDEEDEIGVAKVGIEVDEALDIIEASGQIDPPDLTKGASNPFFSGFISYRTARNETDSIMVIDFELLLDEAEKNQIVTHHKSDDEE